MKFVGIMLLATGLFSLPACHGAQGKVTVPMYPNLAGQNAMYLQHALQAYKKGERNGGQA